MLRIAQPPAWFWIVALVALLWEALGCYNYLASVGVGPPRPGWVTAAFGIATWGGLVAAILLLLRRRHTRSLFAVSLIAALAQFSWVLAASGFQPIGLVVIVAGAAFLVFADLGIRRGWLR